MPSDLLSKGAHVITSALHGYTPSGRELLAQRERLKMEREFEEERFSRKRGVELAKIRLQTYGTFAANNPNSPDLPKVMQGIRQAASELGINDPGFEQAYIGSLMKDQSDPFTLAPGSKRYDSSGKLIAENKKEDQALSTIGKIIADERAGHITPEQARDRINKLNYIDRSGSKDSPFGNSIVGRSYTKLIELKNKQASGQQLDQNDLMHAAAAERVLTTPRIVIGADGERYEMTPGVPDNLKIGTPSAPQVSLTADEDTQADIGTETVPLPSGGSLTKIDQKSDPLIPKRNEANRLISEIVDLLEEAEQKGETITGVSGWVKSEVGGWVRQAGVPVSPLSEKLAKKLGALQAVMSPIITGEKRVSDTERQRVKELVGDVTPGKDDVSLRSSLLEVYDFVNLGE